jgi:hypothetical protein
MFIIESPELFLKMWSEIKIKINDNQRCPHSIIHRFHSVQGLPARISARRYSTKAFSSSAMASSSGGGWYAFSMFFQIVLARW